MFKNCADFLCNRDTQRRARTSGAPSPPLGSVCGAGWAGVLLFHATCYFGPTKSLFFLGLRSNTSDKTPRSDLSPYPVSLGQLFRAQMCASPRSRHPIIQASRPPQTPSFPTAPAAHDKAQPLADVWRDRDVCGPVGQWISVEWKSQRPGSLFSLLQI